ncbi:Ninja-family protein 8, partial [Dichanthelium oligosanthes]
GLKMDDENGLELSLGLSLGGSSGKAKARDAPLEPKAEPQVEESSSKGGSQTPDAPFGKYYQTNPENQEHNSKQRQSPVAPQFGNFWGQPGSSSAPVVDGSAEPVSHQPQFPRYQDGRMSNNSGNNSEEQKPVSSNRNLLSEEMNFQKKHQTAGEQPDAFSKSSDGGAKNAPISISTDDGSTGENEDVAESEAEGSNSWLVAQREDSAKGSVVNKGSDRKRSADDAAVGFQGKRQPSFSGSESSSVKLPPGNPSSMQASNVVAVPYQVPAQVSDPPTITNAPNFRPVCTVQLRPPANGGLAVQTISSASQVAFGYPAVQLPTLETSSSWAFGAPPQVVSSFTAKDKAEQTGTKQADDGKRPQETGASSSAHVEDEKADRALPLMGSAIRPGIAPNVKFGGSGSYPDLPWVSTTGTGANGRTISGVTYKFGRNEVKIVCACHGTHMSPEEFMRHASADAPAQENSATLPAFTVGNQAASAEN